MSAPVSAPVLAPVSVIIPARNEAATIRKVVETLRGMPDIDEVLVVDNGSDDDTARVAMDAGARTVFEARPGMGHALRAGIKAASHDWVMKVDADLDKFDTTLFSRLPKARGQGAGQGAGLIKGAWQDPDDDMPMTRLLVRPAINRMFKGLSHLKAPNSGIYLFDRRLIAHQQIVGSYAADLDVMLRVHAAGAWVAEVDIGRIRHDKRSVQHYNGMAETILAFFLDLNEARITRETIVLAQNARQVIASCLGILASRSISGGAVSVYLAETEGAGAIALRKALAPFPTARIAALECAGEYQPQVSASGLDFIAPYPVAGADHATRQAVWVLRCEYGADEAGLMLMPIEPERGAVGGFRADMALEIGKGAAIKQAALDSLRAGQGKVLTREMFQSFQSLPDTLAHALGPHPPGSSMLL
ncbi:Glycosyltransferase involved in cell wall biogenesis [hydrothermal vent metagenome]|uniref:Glycosyltransferase involved in cell wall biogenesis n=1 Tax=hydrothermal vent metagenome TaxID=652676 RepID=A0A3B0RN61_9ZZZZ